MFFDPSTCIFFKKAPAFLLFLSSNCSFSSEMNPFISLLVVSSLLVSCSERQKDDANSSLPGSQVGLVRVQDHGSAKATQKVQRVIKSIWCESCNFETGYRSESARGKWVTIDPVNGISEEKANQWEAVHGQCMIDKNAVSQDTFEEKISDGSWEVKTVLDQWKHHQRIYTSYDGIKKEYIYDFEKENQCAGSEYVITERIS